jgi:transcriptional regulator GlxA family with amidase domain
MSLTAFMAICIVGLDLLIYVFFHRTYGDKRSAVARQVAAFKGQSPSRSASHHKRPFMGTEQVRVESARLMMEAGRFSAEEIARKNGFGNRERKRRSFVRAFGQPPQTIQRTLNALNQ